MLVPWYPQTRQQTGLTLEAAAQQPTPAHEPVSGQRWLAFRPPANQVLGKQGNLVGGADTRILCKCAI